MSGLWVSPTQHIDFAEIDRGALSGELASRASAYDYAGLMGLLPDPDPVLRKLPDGGVKALEELTADGHLISVIQSRKLGTLKKEFAFEPGTLKGEQPSAAAVKLRDDLVADLEAIDLYNLVSGILDAPYFGMTPIEMDWVAGDGRLRVADLTCKPARWFAYDEENRPKFRSQDNPWEGTDIPFGKFVFARHFPTYDNPYGLRLLSRCLWPVAFKKGGIKFWVQLAEKFGIPFLVGKYAQGTSPAEQQKMLGNLASMVQTAVAVIPQGGAVEILEGAQKASAEIHRTLKEAMDAEMSKVIMGQTLTAEIGNKGSYAAGQVHEEILEDFRQGDQKLVKTVMEEIGWFYGQVNAPGVPTPSFKWFEEEEPQQDFAERDKTLSETGVKFRKSYYVRRYRLQEDDFDLDASAKGTPAPAEPPAFSECPHCRSFAEQGAPDLARQLAALLATKSAPAMDAMVDLYAGLLDKAGSVNEVRTVLSEPPNSDDLEPMSRLAEVLAQHFALANLVGRAEVLDEQAVAFASPIEALFHQPFDQAVKALRDKVNMPTARWDDLWQEEHASGFMVAGAVEADLLADLREAVDKAVSQGITLETFRKEFAAIVDRYGWSYNGSESWRSRVIYETNIRTTYQAGRWLQLTDPETLSLYPYLEYRHGDSLNPRLQHLAWDGLTLPAADPWWSTHYPPNGWGCTCTVFAAGKRDLKRAGKSAPDKAPEIVIDPATGAPEGIDKGWDYNVGQARQKAMEEALAAAVDRLGEDGKPITDLVNKESRRA